MPEKLTPAVREKARRLILRNDPKLAPLVRTVGACGLRPQGRPYPWLMRSILYQQLAGSAARAIELRFLALFGDDYPEPEALLLQRDAKLRAAGLSRQKIAAVRAVAEAMRDGVLKPRRLARLADEAVVAEVTQIRGVGVWTAHMLLMSSLGRADVLPVGDYGVRKGAQAVYGLRKLPDARRLEALARSWAPYRSVGSWYLWRYDQLPAAPRTVSRTWSRARK